jgi:hypothetical protein
MKAALLVLPVVAMACSSSNLTGPDGGDSGGTSACQQIAALDQSCSKDADCIAVAHTTSCCGSASWMGLRTTESSRFASLESACDASYPRCGCAAGPPVTDDGSTVAFGATAAVSCQAGVCKTFSAACGQSCGSGQSCLTCGQVSVCSLRCTNDTACTASPYTKCTFGFSGGLCTDPGQACTGY